MDVNTGHALYFESTCPYIVGTIVVSEFFEDHYILDLTVAIWSLIIGIPLIFPHLIADPMG
jgi:hypothetical protein